MIATPNLDEILGAEVVDPNNDTVGKVGRIYLDSERDVPTWVSVKTGLFGLSETLVPVDDATWEGQVLHVTIDKARIKDAPRVDVDQEIDPQDQERLYSYYDRGPSTGGAGATGDYGSSTAGFGGGADRDRGADRFDGYGSGAAGTGAGAAGIGAGGMAATGADAGRDTSGSATGRGADGMDEPLGGGNQNPAAFEDEGDQRVRDAGRSAGSGQLGGGNQDPDDLDGDQPQSTDRSSLGGGNQNPDQLDGGEGRMGGPGNLGGGSQNPGGFRNNDGVGQSTHGGLDEFSRAGTADDSRRAAAQDDPGRMQLSDDRRDDQQGAAVRTFDDRSGGRQDGMNDRQGGEARSFADVVSGQQGAATRGSDDSARDQGGVRRLEDQGSASTGQGGVGRSDGQDVRPSGGSGGMRLRRYVVTEQQTVSMPVTREEFRLEPDDGEGGDQLR